MERRNPYLVLGVPFGASRDEAVRAFARRTKSLRRLGAAGRTRHTDLTGALREIETRPDDPLASMTPYRIPADPDIARAPGAVPAGVDPDTARAFGNPGVFGTGVFAPPPETFAAGEGAEPGEGPNPEELRLAAAHEYLRHLVRLRGRELGPPAP